MATAMPMAEHHTLRNKLKTLCTCGGGWSYAIFWSFHPHNSSLLTVEDAYCEEQLGEEIANMLAQVHLLGEGIVGEVAFTGKHKWVHSDGQTQEWNLSGQNICEDDSGLHPQFSSGIKTIVVIPVIAWGVVQFGSKNKILERVEFLEQTQRLFMEMDDISRLDMSGNAVSPLDTENYDLNDLLASITSENSYDWNIKYAHGQNTEELLGKVYSTASGDTNDLVLMPNSSMNSLTVKNPCVDAWSGEVSYFDSLGQQLLSEKRGQDDADVFSVKENAFTFSKLTVQDSALTSLYCMDTGEFQVKFQNSLDNQHSAQSSVETQVNFPSFSNTLHGFCRNLEPVDMSEEFFKFSSKDDLCQWFPPPPEDSICRTVTALDSTFSESPEFSPTSFGLVGTSSVSDIPVTCLTGHNTIPDTETSVVMHGFEIGQLECVKLDLILDQADELWGNTLTPVVSAATDTDFSECISKLNTGTVNGTNKGIFPELGTEELLSGESNYNPLNSSNFELELSPNKRPMVEFTPRNGNPILFSNLPMFEARAKSMQPTSDLDKINNLVSKKDTFPRLQVGMRIGDSHSINIGQAVPVHHQKIEEPKKPIRKRARPGESPRPRPKDRQRIQACIEELRRIIPKPNDGKFSIDCLLERTIRYMLFLRSITMYKDKLQEPNEPKLIDQENGVVLHDSSVGDSKNCGVTWAFEMAGQTLVCPIIVEDMDQPGQMLIEMLLEEQGFFLELADTIRGFGLNILKAKMEIRKNKLWARFIVEANSRVTRIDVFWSLIHLLQQTNSSGMDSDSKHCNVVDASISGLDKQLPGNSDATTHGHDRGT